MKAYLNSTPSLGSCMKLLMIEAMFIIINGIAIASLWFWLAVLLKVTAPDRGFSKWMRIWVLQGIIISLAVYWWLHRIEVPWL